ncbi:MAG: hypothetical protein WEC36_04720 [Phycisphaeraceae bacterium]
MSQARDQPRSPVDGGGCAAPPEPPEGDERQLRRVIDDRLAARDWPAAAAALAGLATPSMSDRLKLNLCRNLASLQRHRPGLYELMGQTQQSERYRLCPLPSSGGTGASGGAASGGGASGGGASGGGLTIAVMPSAGGPAKPTLLATGDTSSSVLMAAYERGSCIGLMGMADGRVLSDLAGGHPNLPFGQTVAVHLFEPEPEVALLCLMLHDWSGPTGPIEQARFGWHVGETWHKQYQRALFSDAFLPMPTMLVQQGLDAPAIRGQLELVNQNVVQRQRQMIDNVQAFYARRDDAFLAALLRPAPCDPPRQPGPPRVLLMTNRFTAVLQYSTRDAAAAFAALGWQTHTLIEPHDHGRLSRLAVLEAIDRFKPDIVFALDHLRREEPSLFPPGLPYVSWVQDLMPNLTSRQAGASIGPRDFVMTFATPLFVGDYGYPASQCLDVPMMMPLPLECGGNDAALACGRAAFAPRKTKAASRPPHSISPDADLLYVSNVSQTPAAAVDEMHRVAPVTLHPLLTLCTDRMLAIYQEGGDLASKHALRQLVHEAQRQTALKLPVATTQHLIDLLWNPLNITLYRQQALAWVAAAAEQLNLRLSIYGRGWEQHPDFAAYARGVVAPGQPLSELTRRARINLCLEPYPSVTHNRLLSGLAAGGFFLVRQHPANLLIPALSSFLHEHCDDRVQSNAEARRATPAALRPALDELLDQSACLSFAADGDGVAQVRCYQRAGVLAPADAFGGELLPHLSDVSFHDAATCRATIARYREQPQQCRDIAAAQWASIKDRLTIHTGIRRLVALMAERLSALRQTAAA